MTDLPPPEHWCTCPRDVCRGIGPDPEGCSWCWAKECDEPCPNAAPVAVPFDEWVDTRALRSVVRQLEAGADRVTLTARQWQGVQRVVPKSAPPEPWEMRPPIPFGGVAVVVRRLPWHPDPIGSR